MNPLKIFSFVLLQTTVLATYGQDFTWEKDKDGQLFPPKKLPPAGFKIKEMFDLVNSIPVIANPKGFDVNEWYWHSTTGKRYTAGLNINFFHYSRYKNGPVERHDSHAPTVSISINEPADLRDWQSVLFSEETEAVHGPEIFTDTFEIDYKMINGCLVGEGIFTSAGSSIKFRVLAPGGKRFFRPAIKEEYLKVFVENFRKKVADDEKGLIESKKTLAEMANNEILKKGMDDFRQVHNQMVALVKYERSALDFGLDTLCPAGINRRHACYRSIIYVLRKCIERTIA